MKPLTRRHQYAGEDNRSPLHSPASPQHLPSENVVVVLGVMYPTVRPRPVEASTQLDLAFPSLGLDTGRQSGDVIFYDPLSFTRTGDEVPLALKYRKRNKDAGYVNRAKAQKAVIRDLALLSLRKCGESKLPSLSETTQTLVEYDVSAKEVRDGSMTPLSLETFEWKGLRPGHEIEVIDDVSVIAHGVIEDLNSDQVVISLRLSYDRGRRTYRREDGWQVRTVCRDV